MLGDYALLDLDEPRYPQAALEMIERQNFLVPYFNQEPRYDKPILFYWAEIASLKIFGVSEFAARLPSVLAAIATLSLVYLLAELEGMGWIACMILMSCLEFFMLARMSITDSFLNLGICGSLVFFFLVYSQKLPRNYLYLSSFFLAWGLLAKGPVAFLLPSLIVLVFLICKKDFFFKIHELILLVLFTLLLAAPWYLAVHFETNGQFTQAFFLDHNIQRFTNTVSGHHSKWWYFLPVALIGFMPWTVFAVPAFIKKQKKDLEIFALIWFLVIFVFYSFATTKLANYLLPAFAPLALLTSSWWQTQFTNEIAWQKNKQWMKLFFALVFAAGIFFLIFAFTDIKQSITHENFINHYLEQKPFVNFAFLFILSALLFFLAQRRTALKTFLLIALTTYFTMLISVKIVLLPLTNYMGQGLRDFIKTIPTDKKIVLVGIERPSVNFYSGRHTKKINSKKLIKLLKKENHEEFYFIAKKAFAKTLEQEASGLYVIEARDYLYVFGKG